MKHVLQSPQATEQLAQRIAPHLRAGDVILLQGHIGAGKTHFSRSIIQHLIPDQRDVPSPTFTLVQTYDAPTFEIWHCDLYRLTSPDEALELGLDDAFIEALCLIEWPDRLAEEVPNGALVLTFDAPNQESRTLLAETTNPRWSAVLDLIHG